MKVRILAALALAAVAVFLMGHDTVSRYSFDSIVFSDGTFVHHNRCAEAILTATQATPQTTIGGASGVYTPVTYAHISTSVVLNQNSEFSLGATDKAEMCFDSSDDANARMICSFHADAKMSGPPLFYTIQVGYNPAGAIGNGDQLRATNWTTPVSATEIIQSNQTADLTMADGGCVGLLVSQFGTSKTLSLYSFTLHCRQVSTAALPCHQ